MRGLPAIASALAVSICAVNAAPASSNLPIVNLGYERHQAISFNQTGGTYNFSNIRFAEPPVRFNLPVAPSGQSSEVDDGSVGKICPQAYPAWTDKGVTPPLDPRTTEDCLFLDVIVPKKVFDHGAHQKREYPTGGLAPVLVWIYGGGYTEGEKTGFGQFNPAGLLKAGDDDFVYVAINYRLGVFGWGAGPTLQSDGVANLGLYDQRLALQWVQNHISLFGGDKDRVTVIGESAGGGSIMHQITAFGGLKGPAPFSQAVLQSAAWLPIAGSEEQETSFQAFLKAVNANSVEEARQVSSSEAIAANQAVVGAAPFGSFIYGPAVDGSIVPQQPGRLLLTGSYDHNLKLLIGHNSNEGIDFTNPEILNEMTQASTLLVALPDLSPSVLSYILNTLYPAVFTGEYGYTTYQQRAQLITSDSFFTCNTDYLSNAFEQNAFDYRFAVPPGVHGEDIPYTFYNGPNPLQVTAPTVAMVLQQYIASFTLTGRPSSNIAGAPAFPDYAAGNNEVEFNSDSSIVVVSDEQRNARCAWWQLALYT